MPSYCRCDNVRQRGAVSVIAVMLLAMVVMLLLVMTIQISNSGVNDTLNQSDAVAALYLAESGLENATERLSSGAAACDATLAATASLGKGGFSIAAGMTTDYDGVTALPANQCRVQVTGTINNSNVKRVIQAVVNAGSAGAGISLDNSDVRARNNQNSVTINNFNVGGSNRLLMVGVSLRRDANQTVTGATFGGLSLSYIGAASNDPDIRVELWYLTAPPAGSNNLTVNISGNTNIVVGVASYNGAHQTTPLELPASFNTGNGFTPSVQVTTTTANAWIMDTQGELLNWGLSIPAFVQTLLWNDVTPGNPWTRARGSGSYRGPVGSPGTVSMNWFILPSRRWAIGAVAIRPASNSGGIVAWREIVQ